MSYTDEETMRLQLAACAMAGLLRRRRAPDRSPDYEYTPYTDELALASGELARLAADSLAVADALMAEARKTPSP
jgi:hypothetical protein